MHETFWEKRSSSHAACSEGAAHEVRGQSRTTGGIQRVAADQTWLRSRELGDGELVDVDVDLDTRITTQRG